MRLVLGGDLGTDAMPLLEEELSQARSARLDLLLDIARVEFMDVRVAWLIADTARDARTKGWSFELAPSAAPQVRWLCAVVGLGGAPAADSPPAPSPA